MPLYAASGTFQVASGSVAAIEVNIVDTASATVFQPKVVFFKATHQNGTGTGDHLSIGMGWATAGQQGTVGTISIDQVGTSDGSSSPRTDGCLALMDPGGTTALDGLLGRTSLDSDGFTVTPSNAFGATITVSYLALGGDSLTNVFAGDLSLPTATGNFSETGVGFTGDCLFMLVANSLSGDTMTLNSANVHTGFNFAILKASEGGVVGFSSRGGTAASNCDSMVRRDGTIPLCGDGNSTGSLTLVSFDADGFTLNRAAGTHAVPLVYLVTKGMSMDLVDVTGQASTGQVNYTGVSFKPAALIGAMQYADDTTETTTPDTGVNVCYGWGTGPSNQASIALVESNGSDPINNVHYLDTTNIFTTVLSGGSVTSEVALVSMNADGFTLDHNPVNGGLWPGFLLAMGPAATVSTEPASTEDVLRVFV